MNQQEIYGMLTDRMVSLLEKGVCPWAKPWKSESAPRNGDSGRDYRGINAMLLYAIAEDLGYSDPIWYTFKQAKKNGGSVRKGQKGEKVVFWKISNMVDKEGNPVLDDNGNQKRSFLTRYYTVFNAAQIDGLTLPEQKQTRPEGAEVLTACDAVAVDYFQREACELVHGGPKAYYRPSDDSVHMPERADFHGTEAYYGVLFHEMGHSTGHESRLNRKEMGLAAFGSQTYGREELVAEMTAAFVCGMLGIVEPIIEQSAAYLQSWIKTIKADVSILPTAGQRAQKAADYILKGSECTEAR